MLCGMLGYVMSKVSSTCGSGLGGGGGGGGGGARTCVVAEPGVAVPYGCKSGQLLRAWSPPGESIFSCA